MIGLMGSGSWFWGGICVVMTMGRAVESYGLGTWIGGWVVDDERVGMWQEVWDVVCGGLREAVGERASADGEAVSVNGFGREMGDDVGGRLGWFLGVSDRAGVDGSG